MISNKELIPEIKDYIENNKSEIGEALYAVAGDLSREGKYFASWLILTDTHIVTFDGEYVVTEISDLKSVSVNRMYGNASIVAVNSDDVTVCLFRYTYSVAVICDAVTDYISHIKEGLDSSNEKEILDNTFSKLLRVRPKCGRALQREGSECLKCKSKRSVYKKVSKYIQPELKHLLFCVFLSIITTITVLFPPRMTQMLIDKVIPEKNIKMLFLCKMKKSFFLY